MVFGFSAKTMASIKTSKDGGPPLAPHQSISHREPPTNSQPQSAAASRRSHPGRNASTPRVSGSPKKITIASPTYLSIVAPCSNAIFDISVRWLRRSALQGHASAASDLSGMIWAGLVAARSPDEGCFWGLVASPEGDQGAAEHCRQAQPALSNEALRAVQARAAAWTTVAGGG